ncbi:hypothetical protein [Methanosphaerula palustris]|uniref:Uncharacterized protein n=1 Tax=Methanosphaerula palustris (strain ATCC BAA-1556 / DSM 19958 / E1-9c) TaxID=521011 RepID=B8GKS5_METPE|nr:hypothetical protein [Methanosphaerula palustris]ACL17221.1 hypothetical protein Mpal_1917 [Methanosphaerula palustris E1-9c]
MTAPVDQAGTDPAGNPTDFNFFTRMTISWFADGCHKRDNVVWRRHLQMMPGQNPLGGLSGTKRSTCLSKVLEAL